MNRPITPNAQQAAILDSQDKYNLIYGNAGSAKTTTLSLKVIAALMNDKSGPAAPSRQHSSQPQRKFAHSLVWRAADWRPSARRRDSGD